MKRPSSASMPCKAEPNATSDSEDDDDDDNDNTNEEENAEEEEAVDPTDTEAEASPSPPPRRLKRTHSAAFSAPPAASFFDGSFLASDTD